MRRIVRGAAALALATAAATAIGTGSAHASDQPQYGCPSGAVCIYGQNADYHNGHPTDVFYSYGAHNLSGQFGDHFVLNNQTGGASAHLCLGYNGVDCRYPLPQDQRINYDMDEINSIVLDRP